MLSSVSRSWTESLKIVTEHCSAATKFTLGVMTQVFGAPSTNVASLWMPVVEQLMLNQPGSTSTSSVNVTIMLASRGAEVALLTGSVLTMAGPNSWIGVVRLGFGTPVMKSLPLTFVSVLPPALRKSDVLLLGVGAFVPPSLQLAEP